MRRERFEALAEAYGGDVARWPLAERDAAALLMTIEPAWTGAALASAATLDAQLGDLPAPTASADLVGRILAGAPQARAHRWTGWLLPTGMGVGLATACAAGLLAGAQLSPSPAPTSASPVVAAALEEEALISDVDEESLSFFSEDDA